MTEEFAEEPILPEMQARIREAFLLDRDQFQ
jgi:hypothetical protein